MIAPAGILLILFLGLKKNNLTTCVYVAIFTSVYVKAGYFISIGSVEVMYGQFFSAYCILLFILYGKSFDKKFLHNSFVFLTVFLMSYILVAMGFLGTELVFKSGEDYSNGILSYPQVTAGNIKEFINIIIFIGFIGVITSQNKLKIIEFVVSSGKFVICLALLEFFLKNILHVDYFSKLVNFIFGEGIHQIDFLFQRGSFFSTRPN